VRDRVKQDALSLARRNPPLKLEERKSTMAEDDKGNTPKQMMEALGTPDNPVKPGEFREFWGSLSEEEKAEFRNADLK